MNNLSGGDKLLDTNLILTKAGVGDKMKVADLGCGSTGHFVFPAAAMVGRNGHVFAVDILRTALETINRRKKQENANNVTTVWSNIEIFGATRIESASLDVALLVNTLYQSHKRVEILRESIRMLKKGGKLVIVEWKNVALPFGPPMEERVKPESLKSALPKLGMSIEEEFFAGKYHYGMICLKF